MGNKQYRNRRKRNTGVALVILTFFLLLSGTYAWFHMVDALNNFEEEIKSVVLHDDYDKDQVDQDGYADEYEYNKDVYVENTGGTPLFIRIRLHEYMELGGESVVPEARREDKKTWTPHEYVQSDEEDCGREFHDWWLWNIGGGEQLYTPSQEGVKNIVADRYEGGMDGLDKGTITTKTPDNDPMLLSEYLLLSEAQQKAYTGWLLDETDGWAYWSQKLESKETTGLLLDRVTMNGSITDTYYYAINVVMEAVDETDVMIWVYGGVPKEPLTTEDGEAVARASKDAQKFLKELSNSFVKITVDMGETVPPADEFDTKPDGGDGYLDREEYEAYLKAVEDSAILLRLEIDIADASKMTYAYGADFDRSAIRVTAVYKYEAATRVVTDYTLSMTELKPEKSLTTAADVDVELEVTYSETTADGSSQSASNKFSVKVTNPISAMELDILTNRVQTKFKEGDAFKSTGLIVKAEYESSYKETVTSGFKVTPPDMNAVGKARVEVEYNGRKETYEIEVEAYTIEELINKAKPGDVIKIGSSEWVFLEKNATDGTAYILSRDFVDRRTYHSSAIAGTWKWTSSNIMIYLNGVYWNSGLDKTVKEMVVERTYKTNLPGEKTDTNGDPQKGKVTLLSYEEYLKYCTPGNDRNGKGTIDFSKDGSIAVDWYWWLRSPSDGSDRTHAHSVANHNGETDQGQVDQQGAVIVPPGGVRPAVTIKYR